MMNTALNKQLHGLLSKIGADAEMKAEMVYHFTGGKTSHSSDLDDLEMIDFIDHIQALLHRKISQQDRLRKQLIAMAYSIGEDTNFVKGWCEKYGIFGVKKKFNHYSVKELIGLKEKFKQVVSDRQQAVIHY